jgi:hypothetical protein
VVRYTLICADSITIVSADDVTTLKKKVKSRTRRQSAYDVTPRLKSIPTARIKRHAAYGAVVVELAWVKSPFDGNVADFVDPTDKRGD